jgi:hypothetical protein
VTTNEVHARYFDLILKHGSPEERERATRAMAEMREWRLGFPGSEWDAMDVVELPGFLMSRARRVARDRIERAKQWDLDEKHGARRTLEEEARTVFAQYAACLMLGLPFGAATTHTAARAHGNLGNNCSAFTPRAGSWNLIVGEKEPAKRNFFLIVHEGGTHWRCNGWVRAGEVQIPEYRKTFHREGVASHPFVVPTSALYPLRTWFK